MADISNMEDVMDSRDVVERIDELDAERQTLVDAVEEAEEAEKRGDKFSESGEALNRKGMPHRHPSPASPLWETATPGCDGPDY